TMRMKKGSAFRFLVGGEVPLSRPLPGGPAPARQGVTVRTWVLLSRHPRSARSRMRLCRCGRICGLFAIQRAARNRAEFGAYRLNPARSRIWTATGQSISGAHAKIGGPSLALMVKQVLISA